MRGSNLSHESFAWNDANPNEYWFRRGSSNNISMKQCKTCRLSILRWYSRTKATCMHFRLQILRLPLTEISNHHSNYTTDFIKYRARFFFHPNSFCIVQIQLFGIFFAENTRNGNEISRHATLFRFNRWKSMDSNFIFDYCLDIRIDTPCQSMFRLCNLLFLFLLHFLSASAKNQRTQKW